MNERIPKGDIPMSDKSIETTQGLAPSRRAFLRGAVATGAGLAAGGATAQATPDPLITEVQEWASGTGDGVDETPYGLPIERPSMRLMARSRRKVVRLNDIIRARLNCVKKTTV
ncbi:MAG: hypothetical protein ACJAR9_001933 [Celeribacter sp.]|jgi:hypothetical protein